MNILQDNIIFGLQPRGGISVYWAELLARAAASGILWTDPYLPPGNESRESLKHVPFHRPKHVLPISIERYRSVNNQDSSVHSSYYRIPSFPKTPLITTVYDFTYERYRKGPALWIHHAQKMRAIQRSSKILCISESTARDVVKYGGSHLASRITVTHLAASPAFQRVKDSLLTLVSRYPWLNEISRSKKILLFVGARSGYKRFDLAAKTTQNYPDGHLVVLGGGPATTHDLIVAQDLVSQKRITFLPSVPYMELPEWYSCAFALLYLSDYEGFGLPIIEAALCHCPVLARNTSSIPEVYGSPDFLIESTDQLLPSLTSLESENVRSELISKCLNRAITFSWDKCWTQTLDVYRSL